MHAIFFDWDGTLVDTLDAFHAANSSVMASFGLPFDLVAYRRHYAPDWRVMYRRLGIPDDRLEEANELWESVFGAGADRVAAFPGVAESLERLRSAGTVLGIVTAGHRAVVEPQLERTNLGGLLPIRVFGDDLPVHKPDPEPLRLALRLAGVRHRAATTAYVGDAPTDMLMAVAVGARAIGIESVLGEADALRAAGADEIATSVPEWVDRHLSRDAGSREGSGTEAGAWLRASEPPAGESDGAGGGEPSHGRPVADLDRGR